MSLFFFLAFALPVAFLVRGVVPRSAPVTCVICGMLAAFFGGFVVRLATGGMADFDLAALIATVVVAPLLLLIFGGSSGLRRQRALSWHS